MKAWQLLSKPFAWTQNAYARDKTGRKVHYRSQTAVSFCMLGAIRRCYSPQRANNFTHKLARIIYRDESIKSWYPREQALSVWWNDGKLRTKKEVVALLKAHDI